LPAFDVERAFNPFDLGPLAMSRHGIGDGKKQGCRTELCPKSEPGNLPRGVPKRRPNAIEPQSRPVVNRASHAMSSFRCIS
jgi:hypothetical protein